MKLPIGITKTFGRQVLLAKKNSPAMMFGAGVTTAVAATVFACKATLHLEEVMLKHEEARRTADFLLREQDKDYSEKKHAQDIVYIRIRAAKDIAVLYAPSVALGAISIGLLTGAHITLTRRNAALGAAYAAIDKAYREYRDRVRHEIGDDRERELYFNTTEKEIVEEGEHGHEVKTVQRARRNGFSPYARPFDDTNACWSPSALNNRSFLMAQQNYLNDLLQSRGHVLLNDAYDLLKMERSKAGTVVGWVKGHGDDMVDFGLFNSTDPVIRDFMLLEHNDGIMIDFNVDGVVNDLLDRKF